MRGNQSKDLLQYFRSNTWRKSPSPSVLFLDAQRCLTDAPGVASQTRYCHTESFSGGGKKRKIIHLPWIWNRTYCTVPQGWGLHIVSHCLLWLDSHETRRGYKCSVHSVPLLCFLIFQVILKRIQYFYPSLYTQSITVTSLTQVLGIFINGVFQDCSKAYIGCLYGGMARPKILLNMAAQCEWAERNLNDPDHEKHVLR